MTSHTLATTALFAVLVTFAAASGAEAARATPAGSDATARAPIDLDTARREFLRSEDLLRRWARLNRLDCALRSEDVRVIERAVLLADTRLDDYAADLAGHALRRRVCEHTGDRACARSHAAAVERVTADIAGTGSGTQDEPWRVVSDNEAFNFLRHEGERVLGGLYTFDENRRVRLIVKTRPDDANVATRVFDLSTAYEAARRQRAYRAADDELEPAGFVWALAHQGNPAAQASVGVALLQADTEGRWAEAVRWLTAASDQGNAIAHQHLRRLYQRSARLATLPDAEQRLKRARQAFLAATEARAVSPLTASR